MKKIIFLDFDGPMIPMRIWMLNPLGKTRIEKFDPIAVTFLNYIFQIDLEVRLVISSSWRDSGYDYIVEVIEHSGLNRKNLHPDWATKLLVNHSLVRRPIEIREWLDRHPEVTDFVVIDDANMNIENLIKVTSDDGISFQNQLEILKKLRINYSP